MYYCYSGFRSYLIKILAKKNVENDLHSCVALCYCQSVCIVYNAQQTRLLHLEHLTGWMGWDLLGMFFYSIALGCYIYYSTDIRMQSAFFYVRIFILYFCLKTCLEICFEVILLLETLQLLVLFLYISIRVSYFYNL